MSRGDGSVGVDAAVGSATPRSRRTAPPPGRRAEVLGGLGPPRGTPPCQDPVAPLSMRMLPEAEPEPYMCRCCSCCCWSGALEVARPGMMAAEGPPTPRPDA